MTLDKISDLFFALLGLLFIVKFRYAGKTAIEQRKWLNKFFPFRQSEKDFDSFAVVITQLGFLLIGILFVLVGLAKLFK